MISLYSGTPGSGKSLHCARVLLGKLNTRHYIIANFDIQPDRVLKKKYEKYYIYLTNDVLLPEDLMVFSRNIAWCKGVKRLPEDTILLIIDECQLLFNAREWGQNHRKEWISFFTQHRKFGYQVILIAQFDSMLDKQLRHLIEYEYIHRKVSNLGWRGLLLMFLMVSPNLFVSVKIWYPMQEKVSSEFFRYRSRYARIYDSYKEFEIPRSPASASAARIAERTRTEAPEEAGGFLVF